LQIEDVAEGERSVEPEDQSSGGFAFLAFDRERCVECDSGISVRNKTLFVVTDV
jgi:hypothetical protein